MCSKRAPILIADLLFLRTQPTGSESVFLTILLLDVARATRKCMDISFFSNRAYVSSLREGSRQVLYPYLKLSSSPEMSTAIILFSKHAVRTKMILFEILYVHGAADRPSMPTVLHRLPLVRSFSSVARTEDLKNFKG